MCTSKFYRFTNAMERNAILLCVDVISKCLIEIDIRVWQLPLKIMSKWALNLKQNNKTENMNSLKLNSFPELFVVARSVLFIQSLFVCVCLFACSVSGEIKLIQSAHERDYSSAVFSRVCSCMRMHDECSKRYKRGSRLL